VTRSPAAVAALLFGSGFCALIYQTAWLRQFRLIFGASTFATAAVLAIFMGGLGLGSALLGKRADAHPRPLAFYGNLELLISLSAGLSPLLLWLVAKIYFAVGGSVTLGLTFATVVRLLLSALVLAVPTILMGGTLPAAARAIETSDDAGRRRLALLYGVNTLGAVGGTLASTFFMLEVFGNRQTLFVAVLVNLLVGITARAWGRAAVIPSVSEGAGWAGGAPPSPPGPSLPLGMTLLAAGIVGFAFLLMELVWYRILAPLLGGSTFTFGLILAVALLGIGLGGAAYAFWGGRRRATAAGFALTCSLEAAALAVPFALGDTLALQQNYLRGLGTLGFHGYVLAWIILTVIVVLPAAFIAGVQFPLLISLLGEGREAVGRHVGLAYAWNTAGAIAGSLAGGFGLLPLLTAPGAWRLVVVLLALTAIAVRKPLSAAIGVASIALVFLTLGPTAVWRHSGIGAGRALKPGSVQEIREWANAMRRTLAWDEDGHESSVAVRKGEDLAFIVNGKVDGSARGDAGTQVMAGMAGAILHPDPRRALVIGLGTGSTAGWLGAIPGMERVDAVELEPAVLRVAAESAAVNHDVLRNPKVRIHIGDAREVLLASRDRYDIIFSEPSNPYRAGIASLFTSEFYRSAAERLNRGGLFLQWLQAYDIDAQTMRTIYATIGDAFPHVETWHTNVGDFLLIAAKEPVKIDMDALRARLRQQPYFDAASNAWRVETAEGFLGHFVAGDALTRAIIREDPPRNTDDRTVVEFGFARGLGEHDRFRADELTGAARAMGADRPPHVRGFIDWTLVDANRASVSYLNQLPRSPSAELIARHAAAVEYDRGQLPAALAQWRAHPFAPSNTKELLMIAESLADSGSGEAEPFIERLRPWRPGEANAVLGLLRFRQSRIPEAAQLLARAFVAARTNPWSVPETMERAMYIAVVVGRTRPYTAPMLDALSQPFAAAQHNDPRLRSVVTLARELQGCGPRTLAALRALEPWAPWEREHLTLRSVCYESAMDPRAGRARRDLERFIEEDATPLITPELQSPSGSPSGRR
jgi:spermidine synthase